uniref:Uncharacterized protein n=1 Tax=Rhizophora mucronata TaxID=61149 RepID=A0A2P2NDK9_RHIMU
MKATRMFNIFSGYTNMKQAGLMDLLLYVNLSLVKIGKLSALCGDSLTYLTNGD